jgi:two-component system cell cycle sensor histidine kinase/response regulator CckA
MELKVTPRRLLLLSVVLGLSIWTIHIFAHHLKFPGTNKTLAEHVLLFTGSAFLITELLSFVVCSTLGLLLLILYKKGSAKIKESEDRYRLFFEHAPLGVFVVNSDMRYIKVNQAGCRMTGYSESELLLMNIHDLSPGNIEQNTHTHFSELVQYGELEANITIERKDGEIRTFSLSAVHLPDGNMIGFCVDKTAELKAQAELRASKERYRAYVNNAPIGISVIDSNGRFIGNNPTACTTTGFTEEQLKDMTIFDLVPEKARPIVQKHLETLIRDGERKAEAHIISGTGEMRIIALRAVFLETDRYLMMGENITDKVRLQEELARKQRIESLGILAGGIAHDFNNALSGVMGNISFGQLHLDKQLIDLLVQMESAAGGKQKALKDELKSALSEILKLVREAIEVASGRLGSALHNAMNSAKSGQHLANQLIVFSSSSGKPIKEIVSLVHIAAKTVKVTLSGRAARYNFSLPANVWNIEADPTQISQIFQNLTINALQAMDSEEPTISVTASNVSIANNDLNLPPGQYVKVEFSDNGPGMPEATLKKAFDPFFTTKNRAENRGMGLAIVHRIVTEHGGHISCKSQRGIGTTFQILFPAIAENPSTNDRYDTDGELVASGSGHILIMDDNIEVRNITQKTLEFLGYTVVAVPDGQSVLRYYEDAMQSKTPFDAVILDVIIEGGMGGMDTIKQLKLLDPGVKAIVTTGHAEDSVICNPANFGFVASIAKPASIGRISQVLSKVLTEE